MLALYIYYFMIKEFDECEFTGKFERKRTYATVCACGSRVTATHLICDVQIKNCYVNC